MQIRLQGQGRALTNGTLGNFTANFVGVLGIDDSGDWYLDGKMTFFDTWDFDASTHRNGDAEFKTRLAAALLIGDPFVIQSISTDVYQHQNSKNGRAEWANRTPQVVGDYWGRVRGGFNYVTGE